MTYLSELSKEQHSAVTAPLAPLQVIAGAGSGKTRVLVSRISWMIEEKGVEPKDIFVSAFTKAAAKEIQERVVDITRANELEVATFHAHFYKLLNEYRKENNKSSLEVCREAEKRRILTSLLSKPSKDYPQAINMMGDVIAIGNYISVWKDELLEPHSQDINAVLASSKPNSDIYIAARVYPLYDAELRRLNKLDFDSMLFESWKLLSSDKAFLAKVKAKWKAFMLDEAQDLNTAQWEILRLIAPPQESPNLTIVGDTRQSLYRFRGAVPELTDSFEHVYRNVKIVNLSTNYRSSDYIIEVSNNLVKSLALPDQKPAVKTESKYPVAIEFKDTAEQSAEIINLVNTLKQRGYKGGDVAILMRTNAQSLEIEQSFVSAGLPYWCRTGGFFDRLEIGDIMAYLRLSQDHSDVDSLGKIINRPTRYLGRMYVERVEEVANLGDGDLINAMRVVDKYTTKRMFDKQVLAANDLADLIEFIRDMSPAQAIQKILDSTDYLKWLAVNNGLSAGSDDSRKDNIDALLSSANKYQTIKDFIAFADKSSRLQIESGQSTEICTIHGAKGREWHTVFVSTFVDNFIPHSKAIESPHGLEDERRAAYVAFTRAKRNLVLGVPLKTMPNRSLSPSRFLKDSQIDIEVLKGSNWEQFIQV